MKEMDFQNFITEFIINKNNRFKDSDMRKFLEEKANLSERQSDELGCGYYIGYNETVCDNSDNRDFDEDDNNSLEFIEESKNYSYVYRIGVLSMFDNNKSDFGEFHIGFQSDKDSEMIYMGKIDFEDGENMDITTTIKRIAYSMLKCWR